MHRPAHFLSSETGGALRGPFSRLVYPRPRDPCPLDGNGDGWSLARGIAGVVLSVVWLCAVLCGSGGHGGLRDRPWLDVPGRPPTVHGGDAGEEEGGLVGGLAGDNRGRWWTPRRRRRLLSRRVSHA